MFIIALSASNIFSVILKKTVNNGTNKEDDCNEILKNEIERVHEDLFYFLNLNQPGYKLKQSGDPLVLINSIKVSLFILGAILQSVLSSKYQSTQLHSY